MPIALYAPVNETFFHSIKLYTCIRFWTREKGIYICIKQWSSLAERQQLVYYILYGGIRAAENCYNLVMSLAAGPVGLDSLDWSINLVALRPLVLVVNLSEFTDKI